MKAEYITPAITPLKESGRLDKESQRNLYEHLITGGVSGILILGSIGEFFAISLEEKKEIIRSAAQIIAGRVKFLVGTNSMVPEETIHLSKFALSEGADGVVIIPPYYFSLTQKSIYEFYASIAKEVSGDIYIYNFPDRTGYDIEPETMLRLASDYRNIVGCKDTLSGMDHTREVIKLIKPVRSDFKVYSGFDDNFAYNILSGGDGCIGGLSNVVPKFFRAWINDFEKEDLGAISEKQHLVNQLMDIYKVGMPFVPYIKSALYINGVIEYPKATFPLPQANDEECNKIQEILKIMNLYK